MWEFLNAGHRDRLQPARTMPLAAVLKHDLPKRAGVYMLISDEVRFHYPWGRSKIFYIGAASSIRRRLRLHRRVMFRVERRERKLERARWEYAVAFGASYRYVLNRNRQSDGKKLEKRLLRRFANHYGAPPVANGAPFP